MVRLQRGYTYGASSHFSATPEYGYFQAASSVQGSSTKESLALFKEIFTNFGPEFDQEKLDKVKGAMLRSNASAFETNSRLVNVLSEIRDNGLSDDYVTKNEEIVKAMTLEDIKALANDYLDVNKMIIIVVGDAATQLKNIPEAKLIQAI